MKAHSPHAKIEITTNQRGMDETMGRNKDITPLVCNHSHFTYEERLQLEFYLYGKGKLPRVTSKKALGTLLRKHPRTIAREIRRGMVEHVFDEGLQTRMEYSAEYSERLAREKDSAKGPQLKLGYDYELAKEISTLIKESHFSPYAVIRRFENEGWPTDTRISEKTLYSYIHEGLIPEVTEKDLLLQGKRRRSPGEPRKHSNAVAASKSISKRPEAADSRSEIGHWEGDTVLSGTGKGDECLLTLTERRSRAEIIVKIPSRTQAAGVRAIDALERRFGAPAFRELFRTVTFDNGGEFYDIGGIESSVLCSSGRTEIFFAHPYRASERGTNERHNGLARRFIPKGSAIGNVSKAYVRGVQDWMNTYPRKVLKGLTPLMVLSKELSNTSILKFFEPKSKGVAI